MPHLFARAWAGPASSTPPQTPGWPCLPNPPGRPPAPVLPVPPRSPLVRLQADARGGRLADDGHALAARHEVLLLPQVDHLLGVLDAPHLRVVVVAVVGEGGVGVGGRAVKAAGICVRVCVWDVGVGSRPDWCGCWTGAYAPAAAMGQVMAPYQPRTAHARAHAFATHAHGRMHRPDWPPHLLLDLAQRVLDQLVLAARHLRHRVGPAQQLGQLVQRVGGQLRGGTGRGGAGREGAGRGGREGQRLVGRYRAGGGGRGRAGRRSRGSDGEGGQGGGAGGLEGSCTEGNSYREGEPEEGCGWRERPGVPGG